MSFSKAASGGDQFQPSEYYNYQTGFGHLLLIYPKAYDPAMRTKASENPSSAADCDIVVVDKPGPDGAPLVFREARLFGNLARSVRHLTEPDGTPKKYLGRIGQGEKQVGKNPPWILLDWTDQDLALAQPVAHAFEAGQFGQSVQNPMQQQAPAAPPMQQQWQQRPPSPQTYQQQPPVQQYQAQPPVQQQQFQQTPPSGPPPGQQQWQAPATPQAQWNANAAPAQSAAPAPAQTGASPIDPNVVAFLSQRGIAIQPGMGHDDAVAVGKSFQPDFSQQFPNY